MTDSEAAPGVAVRAAGTFAVIHCAVVTEFLTQSLMGAWWPSSPNAVCTGVAARASAKSVTASNNNFVFICTCSFD